MSGMYVRCGSFERGDKSASALDVVVDALIDVPPGVLDAVRPVFDDRYVSVSVGTAARPRGGPGRDPWSLDEVVHACEASAAEHEPVVFLYL